MKVKNLGVTVKFFGVFRRVSDKSELDITFEGMISLEEIVKKIVENIPQLKETLIDPELRNPKPNTLIFVNGKEISVLNGLATTLREGDEVIFIPVLHGG